VPRVVLSRALMSHVCRYAEFHQTRVNKALHFVGIPLLVVASLGLLSKLALPGSAEWPALRPNAAWLLLLLAFAWYVWQDRRLGLLIGSAIVGGYAVGAPLPVGVLAGLFGTGVVAHVVGHYGFEGKPPSLLFRPVALLEAPAWLLSTWAGLHPERICPPATESAPATSFPETRNAL
jgi:uncharacterized membrane protein YGL010W